MRLARQQCDRNDNDDGHGDAEKRKCFSVLPEKSQPTKKTNHFIYDRSQTKAQFLDKMIVKFISSANKKNTYRDLYEI